MEPVDTLLRMHEYNNKWFSGNELWDVLLIKKTYDLMLVDFFKPSVGYNTDHNVTIQNKEYVYSPWSPALPPHQTTISAWFQFSPTTHTG